jgi:hypothetical protein
MPIIKARDAKNVIVMKRGMGKGYAAIENMLFFNDRTRMLFGDAKTLCRLLLVKSKIYSTPVTYHECHHLLKNCLVFVLPMKAGGIDIYIIPMSDPHLGEYIPEHWQIIRWLTGFTGSAGTVVVTESNAGLWTDSRYFIQAARQLAGSGFEFMRPGQYQRNDYMDFVAEIAGSGEKIGIDGRIFPVYAFRRLEKRLEGKNVNFETNCDLIYQLWSDRPSLPFSLAFDHASEYSEKEEPKTG